VRWRTPDRDILFLVHRNGRAEPVSIHPTPLLMAPEEGQTCAITENQVTINTRVRWVRFNLVGVMGFAIQTLTLWLLVRWAGISSGVGITLAVLAAVSHNFAWHEVVTWPNLPQDQRFKRWLYFHISTGAISVLTNLGLTMIVMTATDLSVVPANVIAVIAASTANFWINDRLIFRPAPALMKSLGASSISQGNGQS
jgi:putative flippase GtrA